MTTFLFVRHGEPDYSSVSEWARTPMGKHFAGLSQEGRKQIEKSCDKLVDYDVELIISSPFTRTMQGAAIMAKHLNVDILVEKDLHEWQSDLTYSITKDEELLKLCQEHDRCNGVYPEGTIKKWESTELVRKRVLNCLKKYRNYKCVVVSGHAMMMQAVLEISESIEYGQVIEFEL